MAGIRDSFVDLERHRLQLEQNVAKLRASLRHWQQWELEYEGMKEDVSALADDTTPVDSVVNLFTLESRNTDSWLGKPSGRS